MPISVAGLYLMAAVFAFRLNGIEEHSKTMMYANNADSSIIMNVASKVENLSTVIEKQNEIIERQERNIKILEKDMFTMNMIISRMKQQQN